MITAMCLLLSGAQDGWERIAEYQPDNLFTVLEITDAKADYVPFFHDEKKPDQCMPSRITLTFTITNKGKRAQRLPKFICYEANSPRPWLRRTTPIDLTKEADPEVRGIIQLNASQRVSLKPGESTRLTHQAVPPHGPWNPMKLQVRFGEQVVADMVWVGLQRPFSFNLSVNAPDYRPLKSISKALDGKPEAEATRFQILAEFVCEGPAVGGPVSLKVRVPRQGSTTTSLSAGESYDNDSFLSLLSKELDCKGRPNFDSVFATIEVGCPKHKWQYRLIDANPSNDTRELKRSKGEGDGVLLK